MTSTVVERIPHRDLRNRLLPGPRLRSLDALHLATAIVADADVLVAHDPRLLEAAESEGLATHSPG